MDKQVTHLMHRQTWAEVGDVQFYAPRKRVRKWGNLRASSGRE